MLELLLVTQDDFAAVKALDTETSVPDQEDQQPKRSSRVSATGLSLPANGAPRKLSGDLPMAFKGQTLSEQIKLVNRARKLSAAVPMVAMSEDDEPSKSENENNNNNNNNDNDENDDDNTLDSPIAPPPRCK